ncbi:TetR/AcrR family transcriptional regulator [Gilliamella sp. wkB112]|uniref:TetR/AcrR family transcriptional regulator n=1 Tax=Gilliamella sp. wkB112 TaxID=3120257 RepID=UPI00080D8DF2|nr:TetR/AcrR family transcriptional regulator [Gilliamella apicola]OCG02982.1 hypothetical protein A9G12_08640 [Gilliamella apicola]
MKKAYDIIAKTAEKLFNQSGFGNVGVDEIRDQSGCSKTTLYKNFGSKDKLIHDVLKIRDMRFKQALEESIEDTIGYEAINKLFQWHCRWFAENDFNGCLFTRAIEEKHNEESIEAIVFEHKEFIRELINRSLKHYSNRSALTNNLMIILEGFINISVIYKNHQNQYQQIAQDTLELVSNLLKNQ